MKKKPIKNRSRNTRARHKDTAQRTLHRSQLIGAAIIASSGMIALAAAVPNTFTAGTPAVAADVNANFEALAAAVTALETKLASVSTLTVNGQPTVRFTGVNVQVVNGAGATSTINGTGNLIVGYDEVDVSNRDRCSIGMNGTTPLDPANCVANGGTRSTTGFKSGSHYLVVGSQNNYSNFGGIVAGYRNFSNWNYASVSGGGYNTASGASASVSGGQLNTAAYYYASVSGGGRNTASGISSSVSGGDTNTASADFASVSGGYVNVARGTYSSVAGGYSNLATGAYASVTGGASNTASGPGASVGGGVSCGVASEGGWDVGTLAGPGAACSTNVNQ